MKRRPAKKTARRLPRRRSLTRRPNPARKAVARAPLTYDAVAVMGAAEINKRLDVLDQESSAITDEFIATGRGYERPSERRHKTDPLSLRDAQNAHDRYVLHAEIARRYGPGAPSRLPTRAARTIRTRNPSKPKKFKITGVEFVRTGTHKVYIETSTLGDIRVIVYPSPLPMRVLSSNDLQLLETDLTEAQQKMIRAAVKKVAGEQAHRNPAPKPRTYAVARAQIINALRADGWDVRENLKVPHATHPSGEFRLWFKTQAIHYTTGDRRRGQGSLSDAHSLWIGDIRAMPVAEVLADIERSRAMEARGR
jgi:hypothetical protein